MARNAEKAMTTLARWRAAQVQEAGGQRERRPYLASECNDLPQAEKWRLQIVREIAKKVAQIQNAYTNMDQISLQEPKSHEESIKSQNKSVIHSENPVTLVAENETLAFPTMPSPSTLTTQNPSSPLSSNIVTPRASIKSDGKRKNQTLSPQSPKSISLKSPVGGKLTDIASTLNREIEKEPSTEDVSTTRSPVPVINNIDKIANMTKKLTNEANALRESIKSLSDDITKTKEVLASEDTEDVNFPYHLFLIELIINRIHMKCDCFELDYNNLVIAANFLGKQPIVFYDMSYGKVVDFDHLNVGKSILFAMTYDKICGIKEFVVNLQMSKQPPCSNCVTKIAETKMDYTKQFAKLREELCKKWAEEQPTDNIICTTSTPLSKQMFYLYCGDSDHSESIGMVEITTRMSFLGKEITTAFSATSKPQGTAYLRKEDNGMSLYACQNVEMDCQGKVLLDEEVLTRREVPRSMHTMSSRRPESPVSQLSTFSPQSTKEHGAQRKDIYNQAGLGEFRIRDLNDEINKLMREKRHWEVQIRSLGGPDHARVGPRMLDQDGKEVPGNRGYKYFGAAKDLPGVRELFEQEPPPPPRRTRADLMRDVDADYYGYRDDDDGLLEPLEKEAEKNAIARVMDEWERNKEQNTEEDLPEEENIYPEDPEDKRLEDDEEKLVSHVAVPSQKDVEEALLRRKKQELLEKYGCLDVKIEGS